MYRLEARLVGPVRTCERGHDRQRRHAHDHTRCLQRPLRRPTGLRHLQPARDATCRSGTEVRDGTCRDRQGYRRRARVAPGIRVALSGTAHVDPGFRSGSFSVYGRRADGRRTGGTITGRLDLRLKRRSQPRPRVRDPAPRHAQLERGGRWWTLGGHCKRDPSPATTTEQGAEQAISRSPLTDSNRRPPPYHGGFGLLLHGH